MIRSVLLLQVSQVLGRGLYILFSFYYINRYFGVEGKGVWAGLFALFSILSAGSNLGFEVWLTREVAAGTISRSRAKMFLVKAKGGLWIAALLIGAYVVAADNYPPWMAAAFGVALLLEGVALAEQAVFEGFGMARQISVMSFIKSGGFTLLALPIVFLKPETLTVFAWVFALALLVRTAYGWYSWSLLPEQAPVGRGDSWRAFLLMGSFTLVTVLYFRVDVLMLSLIHGKVAAGDYDNAYLFVEGTLFISAAVGTIAYPKLVQATGEGKAAIFDGIFKVVLMLGFCGALCIGLLGEPFGRLMIGELFDGAKGPLVVLAFALPVMFVNGLLNRWLFSEHRERFALFCALGVAVFNIVGNALVIPHYGPAGAAAMTVLTEGLLLVLWLIWGRRSMVLLAWVLGSFLVFALVTWLGQTWVWIKVCGLFGFTALLLVRLKLFSEGPGRL